MNISAKKLEKINQAIPVDVLKSLADNNLTAVDIYEIVSKEISSKKKESIDTSAKVLELNTLINSIPSKEQILVKNSCPYFINLKQHKQEFLRLLAEGLLKGDFSEEVLVNQLNIFWQKPYSLLNILTGLGYNSNKSLLKFIGIQNDGMLVLGREVKCIKELVAWIKDKKIENILDIEDCYFWCLAKYTDAAKSYTIVVKWISYYIEHTERINDRLVFSNYKQQFNNTDDDLYFLK